MFLPNLPFPVSDGLKGLTRPRKKRIRCSHQHTHTHTQQRYLESSIVDSLPTVYLQHHHIQLALSESRSARTESSQIKQLAQLPHRILRILDGMTCGPGILKDLIIIASLVSFVSEKVNGVPTEILSRLAVFNMRTIECNVA